MVKSDSSTGKLERRNKMSRIILLPLMVTACFCGPDERASAMDDPPFAASKTVISDRPTKMDFRHQLNPDCTSQGRIDVRIITPPKYGQLSVRNGRDYPFFTSENRRIICNPRVAPSTQVWYRSYREYYGKDYYSIRYIFGNGDTTTENITVNIVR